MAPLHHEVPDPAREADEGRMAARHVPDAQLGLGQVQDREPAGAGELDDGNDERDRDQDPETDRQPPRGTVRLGARRLGRLVTGRLGPDSTARACPGRFQAPHRHPGTR